MTLGQMTIHQITCYGYHGTHPAERNLGQKYIVNISLVYPVDVCIESDQIDSTINYIELYKITKQIVETNQCHLLEKLTSMVAQAIWTRYSMTRLTVTIIKEKLPVNADIRQVEFSLTLDR